MKQISINLPGDLIKAAQRESLRQRRRNDGTMNTTAAVLRDWIIAGKHETVALSSKMGATADRGIILQ